MTKYLDYLQYIILISGKNQNMFLYSLTRQICGIW